MIEIFPKSGWSDASDPDFTPGSWPTNWRRLFLLTIPISGPVYLLGMIGLAFFMMVVFSLMWPFWLASDLWRKPGHD